MSKMVESIDGYTALSNQTVRSGTNWLGKTHPTTAEKYGTYKYLASRMVGRGDANRSYSGDWSNIGSWCEAGRHRGPKWTRVSALLLPQVLVLVLMH